MKHHSLTRQGANQGQSLKDKGLDYSDQECNLKPTAEVMARGSRGDLEWMVVEEKKMTRSHNPRTVVLQLTRKCINFIL